MAMSDMDSTLRSEIDMADCTYQKIYGERLDKLENEQDGSDVRISKVEQNQAVMMERITISLDHLSRLPEAIDSLKTTNIKLENKIDNVENKVNTIDEDKKINVRQGFKAWFAKNWMYIGLAVLLGGLYLTEVIKNWVAK